ncbi:hypothetical protein C1645_837899 [Glomus cerebriforme]|uniref:Uncharacterized protein n=1 Tax=Glomus cerebriforme TaxID=658196 RepID=A0A397SA75_9GLOM|nr:hypothetical protein C1645_837899 [Glomus cerebriforme]
MSYIPAILVKSFTSTDPSNSRSNKGKDHENKNNDDIDKDIYAKVNKEAFYQSFEKNTRNNKIKLSSGRVIEDLLFNYIKNKNYEDHVHSFIINCNDQSIRGLFNNEECKELTDDRNELFGSAPGGKWDKRAPEGKWGMNFLAWLLKKRTFRLSSWRNEHFGLAPGGMNTLAQLLEIIEREGTNSSAQLLEEQTLRLSSWRTNSSVQLLKERTLWFISWRSDSSPTFNYSI